MFKPGDKVVMRGKGVATIKRVENKTVGGHGKQFYILGMESGPYTCGTYLIPVSDDTTIRPIVNESQAIHAIELIAQRDGMPIDYTRTWNKRYREYTEELETGDLVRIAVVYKRLSDLRVKKDLSFGERKLLDRARTLLIGEISVALNVNENEAELMVTHD